MNNINGSHKRFNPLTNEWVLVSPHRSKRPWQGQKEKSCEQKKFAYDKDCYLCPGNTRVGGLINPNYKDVFAFQNDFSALLQNEESILINEDDLFKAQSEYGICRVICFSPDHSLTIPEMDIEDIEKVISLWCNEYAELGRIRNINYVQIFENKGSVMGCSNPHPHGQIWASSSIPLESSKESVAQKKYYKKHEKTLLSDYLCKELEFGERVLIENDSFVALVPYWAIWPFETMIISKRSVPNILGLNDKEHYDFAKIYHDLTVLYDNLFEISFPYSAGIHQAPTDNKSHPEWHLHMHFYPPLLRSATVKKFMVGYEMLATPQRDITPEDAAKRLKSLSKTHYKLRNK
ncbi:MAG: UDP-glucose--hexose-1-phosphate uridylyltransferase [Bacteroidales bacterium]